MSNVYFTSDLHIGHRNIAKYRSFIDSCEENTEFIIENFKGLTKRDHLYILGDSVFSSDLLWVIDEIPCKKSLVLGNHCLQYSNYDYAELRHHFEKVYGFYKYKDSWLSHCPVHPLELRGRFNIHGHNHAGEDFGEGYFNVCIDVLMEKFNKPYISYKEIIGEVK